MLDNTDENLESAILFETKEDALESLTLSDHVGRLHVCFINRLVHE